MQLLLCLNVLNNAIYLFIVMSSSYSLTTYNPSYPPVFSFQSMILLYSHNKSIGRDVIQDILKDVIAWPVFLVNVKSILILTYSPLLSSLVLLFLTQSWKPSIRL